MDASRHQTIKRIVLAAMDGPRNGLAAFLREQCGDDDELRREVEELLLLDVRDTFLADSPVQASMGTLDAPELTGNVGRIHIERLIARGGMGEVYVGVDNLLERPVAVKVMRAGLRMSAQRRSAFLNEARMLGSLKHENICQVFDFFEDDDKDVLVLELIDGKTLSHCQKDGDHINALDVLIQIASALAAAHERGIAHHDLKPDNVMITSAGVIKVLDFGLARSGAADSTECRTPSGNAVIAGTPGYMAPEQARGGEMTTAVDLWSFGVMASELFSGRASAYGVGENNQVGMRDNVVAVPAGLPRAETRLLRGLLQPDPTRRMTAREALIALRQIGRRPARRLISAAVVLAVTAAALIGWRYTADLQAERTLALEQKQRADAARAEAEELVTYMLEDLYRGLRSVGRLELLESVANQALGYYDALDADRLSATDGQPAVALIRIAEVIDSQGSMDEATAVRERALGALVDLQTQKPENALVAYRLGDAHLALAEGFKVAGMFARGEHHARQAMALGKQLTTGLAPGAGPEASPNGHNRWRLTLRGMYMVGDMLMRQGQSDQSAPILDAAVELAVPAVAADEALAPNLADIQFKRCDIYFELELPQKAVSACRTVFDMDRALYEAKPDDYRLRSNFALDHATVGRVLLETGQPQEALALFDSGAAIYRELIEWDSNNTNAVNDLVFLLLGKGQALSSIGKDDESIAIFNRAYELIVPLARDREEVTFINNLFAALVHLGRIAEAEPIGAELVARGFRRLEFRRLCEQHSIASCVPVLQMEAVGDE